MLKYLKEIISKPTSGEDIINIIKREIPIYSYKELYKFENINQILGKNKEAVILYEWLPNNGHWTCIFVNSDNKLEYFDSYGNKIDDYYKKLYLPYDYIRMRKTQYPYLAKLLIESPYELVYNEIPLQELNKNVNDCGRWVAMRLYFKNNTLYEFANFFKSNKKLSPDEFVSLLSFYFQII